MLGDHPPWYMVRIIRGKPRPEIYRLRLIEQPRWWKFRNGIAVVNQSITEALELATYLAGRPE